MLPLSFLHVGLLACVAALILVLARTFLSRQRQHRRLPPGPKPLPFIGNVLDLPPKGKPEFQHWFQHKDAYGPISSVTVMGIPLIIFHDKEAANVVMGKKAQKTSARPQLNFARMCGFENFLITHQYDAKYRKHRKMVHQEIGTKSLSLGFQATQEQEALQFVLSTFHDPDNMMKYLKTLAAAIVLKITYGYSIERTKPDPLAKAIEHAMDNLSLAFVPLSWAVDALPALDYLPQWFPGLSYRKTAEQWRAINQAAAEMPFQFVRRQVAQGAHHPSYVSNLIEQNMTKGSGALAPEDEEAIKWSAVSLYAAGSDSTVAIMESVILAFLLFPEVVERAHDEIDRVVGSNRLPTFDDRKNLSYVDAIIKEAWRWNPVGPMGLTHKAEEDIVYGDYLIPAGALLLPSLWWFLHDPTDYAEPMKFKPERYLPPLSEPDPSEVAFGYGRRSCSGRYFADGSVYATISQLLAVFDVRKATDAHGAEIPVKLESVAGMVNRPMPFAFKIVPRSAQHAKLLRRIEAEMPPACGQSHLLGDEAERLMATHLREHE